MSNLPPLNLGRPPLPQGGGGQSSNAPHPMNGGGGASTARPIGGAMSSLIAALRVPLTGTTTHSARFGSAGSSSSNINSNINNVPPVPLNSNNRFGSTGSNCSTSGGFIGGGATASSNGGGPSTARLPRPLNSADSAGSSSGGSNGSGGRTGSTRQISRFAYATTPSMLVVNAHIRHLEEGIDRNSPTPRRIQEGPSPRAGVAGDPDIEPQPSLQMPSIGRPGSREHKHNVAPPPSNREYGNRRPDGIRAGSGPTRGRPLQRDNMESAAGPEGQEDQALLSVNRGGNRVRSYSPPRRTDFFEVCDSGCQTEPELLPSIHTRQPTEQVLELENRPEGRQQVLEVGNRSEGRLPSLKGSPNEVSPKLSPLEGRGQQQLAVTSPSQATQNLLSKPEAKRDGDLQILTLKPETRRLGSPKPELLSNVDRRVSVDGFNFSLRSAASPVFSNTVRSLVNSDSGSPVERRTSEETGDRRRVSWQKKHQELSPEQLLSPKMTPKNSMSRIIPSALKGGKTQITINTNISPRTSDGEICTDLSPHSMEDPLAPTTGPQGAIEELDASKLSQMTEDDFDASYEAMLPQSPAFHRANAADDEFARLEKIHLEQTKALSLMKRKHMLGGVTKVLRKTLEDETTHSLFTSARMSPNASFSPASLVGVSSASNLDHLSGTIRQSTANILARMKACEQIVPLESVFLHDTGETISGVTMGSSCTDLIIEDLWMIEVSDIEQVSLVGQDELELTFYAPVAEELEVSNSSSQGTTTPESPLDDNNSLMTETCTDMADTISSLFSPGEMIETDMRFSLSHINNFDNLAAWVNGKKKFGSKKPSQWRPPDLPLLCSASIDKPSTSEAEDGGAFRLCKITLKSKRVKSIAMTLQMVRASLNAIAVSRLGKIPLRTIHIIHLANVCQLGAVVRGTGRRKRETGGVSRYMQRLADLRKERSNDHFLIVCSGNVLGPSLMSVETKGRQMIEALNCLGLNFATFGFYEFSYGLKALKDSLTGFAHNNFVYSGSKATWVCSNLKEEDGSPIAGAEERVLFTWAGVRVGVLGLCENFLGDCRALSPGEVVYSDIINTGRRISEELVAMGAELVIAITHCSKQLDRDLRQQCSSIDIILGGREREYKFLRRSGILKSGSDFEFLSEISIQVPPPSITRSLSISVLPGNRPPAQGSEKRGSEAGFGAAVTSVNSENWSVPSKEASHNEDASLRAPTHFSGLDGSNTMVNPGYGAGRGKTYQGRLPLKLAVTAHPVLSSHARNEPMEQLIAAYHSQQNSRLHIPIGRTIKLLDPTPAKTHREEGLLTDFVANVMCDSVDADFAIISGGAISGTSIIQPKSNVTVGDVVSWFPYDTKVMSLTLTGHVVVKLLNAMVRSYAVCKGHHGTATFPHVSYQLRLDVNCLKSPPCVENVLVTGKPIDLNELYSVAVEDTMGRGRDIYKFLLDEPTTKIQVALDNAVQLAAWTRNYFTEKKGGFTSAHDVMDAFNSGQLKPGELVQSLRSSVRGGSVLESSGYNSSLSMRSATSVGEHKLPAGVFMTTLKNFRPTEFSQNLGHMKLAKLYGICNRLTTFESLPDLSSQLGSIFKSLIECEGLRFLVLDPAAEVLHSADTQEKALFKLADFSYPSYALNEQQVLHIPDVNNTMCDNSSASGSPKSLGTLSPRPRSPGWRDKKGLGSPQQSPLQVGISGVPQEDARTPNSRKTKGRARANLSEESRLRDPTMHHGSYPDQAGNLIQDLHSCLVLPVFYRGSPLGVVQVFNKMEKDLDGMPVTTQSGFTEEDVGISLLLVRQVAVQTHFISVCQEVIKSESANHALLTMTRELNHAAREESVNKMIVKITECAKSLLSCDRASLFLVNKQEMWTVWPTKDFANEIEVRLPVGTGTVGKCADTCTVQNVHDAYKCEDFNPAMDRKTGYQTKTILCFPLLDEATRQCSGVMQFINKKDGTVFNNHDTRLASQFGHLAMATLNNCTHMETLRKKDDGESVAHGLQVLPVLDVNRVRIKAGWHTIRWNLKKIISKEFIRNARITLTDRRNAKITLTDRRRSSAQHGGLNKNTSAVEDDTLLRSDPLNATDQHEAAGTGCSIVKPPAAMVGFRLVEEAPESTPQDVSMTVAGPPMGNSMTLAGPSDDFAGQDSDVIDSCCISYRGRLFSLVATPTLGTSAASFEDPMDESMPMW